LAAVAVKAEFVAEGFFDVAVFARDESVSEEG